MINFKSLVPSCKFVSVLHELLSVCVWKHSGCCCQVWAGPVRMTLVSGDLLSSGRHIKLSAAGASPSCRVLCVLTVIVTDVLFSSCVSFVMRKTKWHMTSVCERSQRDKESLTSASSCNHSERPSITAAHSTVSHTRWASCSTPTTSAAVREGGEPAPRSRWGPAGSDGSEVSADPTWEHPASPTAGQPAPPSVLPLIRLAEKVNC